MVRFPILSQACLLCKNIFTSFPGDAILNWPENCCLKKYGRKPFTALLAFYVGKREGAIVKATALVPTGLPRRLAAGLRGGWALHCLWASLSDIRMPSLRKNLFEQVHVGWIFLSLTFENWNEWKVASRLATFLRTLERPWAWVGAGAGGQQLCFHLFLIGGASGVPLLLCKTSRSLKVQSGQGHQ